MIVEMRTYDTLSGARERFLEMFRARTMPEHERLGMPVLGPFPAIEDRDTFVFMRGFADLEARERAKAELYEDALWKEELEAMMMPMLKLKRYDVVLVDDPDGPIRWEGDRD